MGIFSRKRAPSKQPVLESAAGSQTTLPSWKSISLVAQAEAVMDVLAEVEIDKEGKLKYILVKVWPTDNKEGEEGKLIVRGTAEAEFHPDIMAKLEPKLETLGLQSKVLGGGKIIHSPVEKSIKVFSKSTGFGRADHSVTVDLLKRNFTDYTNIVFTDED